MPINFTDFSNIKPITMGNLAEPYMEGRNFATDQQQKKLAMEMLKAQTFNEQRFGAGKHLTGIASNVFALEQLKNAYGEDSPIYQKAKFTFDLNNENIKSNIAAREFYTDPLRNLTQKAKEIYEGKKLAEGQIGDTDVQLTPEEAQRAQDQYQRNIENANTPTPIQQQVLYGQQFERTLELIDPKKLYVYNGPGGVQKLLEDKNAQLQGKAPQRYLDFVEQLAQIKIGIGQYRNYAKDSISPQKDKELNDLFNPRSWIDSPKAAEAKFKSIKNLFGQEFEITRRFVKKGSNQGGIFQKGQNRSTTGWEGDAQESNVLKGKPIGQSSTNTQEQNSQLKEYIAEQKTKGRVAVTNGKKVEFIPEENLTSYLLKNRGAKLYGG